ncbi:MAG: FAD-dependent oxidoreductase [Pseudomonadota bacterium]
MNRPDHAFDATISRTHDPILEPFQLKGLTLRNRIMSTSHACGLEEDGGMPGSRYQRYHVEKARGGLALTMFGGSSYVSRDSTWPASQLNIATDRIIPYLQKFSQAVHDEGAAIMIQITHLGRRGETNTQNWLPTIGPSVVRETGHRSFPREMDRSDIDRVVREFGDAALRAKEGGLDGLETMTAGHLIGQFFSPVTNRRTDAFGGSLANRCRFGLMVHEEIRKRVGDAFIVGMRYLIDETMQGGLDFEDCVAIARIFEDAGTVDFFNANYGRLDTELTLATDCMPGLASPIAPWLKKAGAFKRAVNLPVFHAAKITDMASARYAVSEGLLDMVAMTRAHIADPHIVAKIQRGEEARIRPCVGASHCMSENRPTCLHNAATARELHWPQTIDVSPQAGKRVVVVGAGPAGLEAARICAERGHSVIVFEAADAPGGQLRLATAASWRGDMQSVIAWRVDELARLGAEIRYNTLASAEDIRAEAPDIVIVATGGVPDLDWIEGAQHITSAWDIISGAVSPAPQVVVYDGTGRHPALTAADVCHRAGADVSLVALDDRPGVEMGYAERVIWKRTLAEAEIAPVFDTRLARVERDGNVCIGIFHNELTGHELRLRAPQIIVEHGTIPADDIFRELEAGARNQGRLDEDAFLSGARQPSEAGDGSDDGFTLYRIGDAMSSRNVAAAMFDALRLCSVL